jgi:hypothetical protein
MGAGITAAGSDMIDFSDARNDGAVDGDRKNGGGSPRGMTNP